jgi:hypothetical protein
MPTCSGHSRRPRARQSVLRAGEPQPCADRHCSRRSGPDRSMRCAGSDVAPASPAHHPPAGRAAGRGGLRWLRALGRSRAAASSMASGKPSRRVQIDPTAGAFAAVSSNDPVGARARRANNADAVACSSGGTVNKCSPPTCSSVRLVTRIFSRGQPCKAQGRPRQRHRRMSGPRPRPPGSPAWFCPRPRSPQGEQSHLRAGEQVARTLLFALAPDQRRWRRRHGRFDAPAKPFRPARRMRLPRPLRASDSHPGPTCAATVAHAAGLAGAPINPRGRARV